MKSIARALTFAVKFTDSRLDKKDALLISKLARHAESLKGGSKLKGEALADALVCAVAHIDACSGDDGDDVDEDNDVGALESIAHYLSEATEAEKDALALAASRALEKEKAGAKRKKFIKDYSHWMEFMFVAEEWKGNRRA